MDATLAAADVNITWCSSCRCECVIIIVIIIVVIVAIVVVVVKGLGRCESGHVIIINTRRVYNTEYQILASNVVPAFGLGLLLHMYAISL